jgi:chemotaxis protein methyltransferase CheR
MALPESRASDLERAVQRAAADSGAPDAGALYELLLGRAHSCDPLDALISALNVSETHFFRDAGQIQALEQRILPELISRRRPERRLRLWSAGCSTGEEAYTLSILVERLLPDLAQWDVLILATDINGRSLERARRGVYGAWSLRGMSPLVARSYLNRRGDRFEVAPRIRAMVTFARLNLAEDVYPSLATNTQAMDLVLCRNVLVYFDAEGGRAVVGRLRDALGDGGWLLVSQVEAGLRVFDGLAQDAPGTAIYRKAHPRPAEIDVRREERAAVPRAAEPERPVPTSTPRRRQPPPRTRARGADDPPAAHEEALRLWRSGLREAALRRLEAVTESRPLAAPLHYLYGLILLDGERTDEALAAFRRCTYADPEFALAHLAQAGLFARMGLRGRARAALETTTRLVAGLEPDAVFFQGDGLTVGDVLELIAAQRELLAPPDAADASRG